jgi:HEPN domain
MDMHLKQALHNTCMLEDMEKSYPNNYFDWKITVCFYISLHLLRAFAVKEGISLGNDHESVFQSFREGDLKSLLTPDFKKAYSTLSRYSRTARYSGFASKSAFDRICKDDFKHCKSSLEKVIKELEYKGVSIKAVSIS